MKHSIQVTAIGKVDRPYELRFSAAGKPWGKFTLVVERGSQGKTFKQFLSCVAFGDYAKHIEAMLEPGTDLRVAGELERDDFLDKKTNEWTNGRVKLVVSEVGVEQEAQKVPEGMRSVAEVCADDGTPF